MPEGLGMLIVFFKMICYIVLGPFLLLAGLILFLFFLKMISFVLQVIRLSFAKQDQNKEWKYPRY